MDPRTDLVWQTSLACSSSNCVAVARSEGTVYIRRSESPTGPVLEFTAGEWREFLAGARLGQFDVELPEVNRP